MSKRKARVLGQERRDALLQRLIEESGVEPICLEFNPKIAANVERFARKVEQVYKRSRAARSPVRYGPGPLTKEEAIWTIQAEICRFRHQIKESQREIKRLERDLLRKQLE